MTPLLEQFLSESRDAIQSIGEKLMQLETRPDDQALMGELFRLVHTLKGNSGLFDLPEMIRVLHAAEDLMDTVRAGRATYSQALADQLLEAMDFVLAVLDEIQQADSDNLPANADRSAAAVDLARSLQQLKPDDDPSEATAASQVPSTGQPAGASTSDSTSPSGAGAGTGPATASGSIPSANSDLSAALARVPEALRMQLYRQTLAGETFFWICYEPEEECFFKGEDPFFQIIQVDRPLWRALSAREPWPDPETLDAYRCLLRFECITAMDRDSLAEHFRYVPDQVQVRPITLEVLPIPTGAEHDGVPVADYLQTASEQLAQGDLPSLIQSSRVLLELAAPGLRIASAMRWLLLLLETQPEDQALPEALLARIRQLEDPMAMAALPSDSTAGAPPVQASTQAEARPEAQPTADQRDSRTPAEQQTGRLSIGEPLAGILQTQAEILALEDHPDWLQGRLRAVAASLRAAFGSLGDEAALTTLQTALEQALEQDSPHPLRDWIEGQGTPYLAAIAEAPAAADASSLSAASASLADAASFETSATPASADAPSATGVSKAAGAASSVPGGTQASNTASAPTGAQAAPRKFGRRLEDNYAAPSAIKVDQVKIDTMMSLIGEMIVAKNALPYLAARAEKVFGVRDLAREIKGQYSTIHRIADEMQDAIMQIRLLPVSFVFQRFPRLVRDTAKKLGKEVHLVMEGESTEADKNVIESLADPLVHIIRNSLDHGLETADERRAAGKPAAGQLSIRARSESDRVVIEIADDGRGIDPETMRRKAYEKGIIDEQTLERLSDQEAVNLVFAAGFSTAAKVSDLSGRGVGMDVVRNAVAQVNGSIDLKSEPGKGTLLRLSLPLSMAVSNVMIIQSAGQRFGVAMDAVAETVRVPETSIQTIKQQKTTVLRGRVMPLMALNDLLGLGEPQVANDDRELAVLVVRIENDFLGIIVDDCLETVDIILKPLAGFLGNIKGYAGSALLGDGSVLLVINPRGLL
ncbi:MAG: ATP-binding protein [Lamprobacter sp.]|uniref:chemotaxis protein CheA n=1 Tax=Lamprobacter sp. TaxID=3100796 RepID=UPI002B256946|nr:ATP-binding protein [Lamprobacter sp.]MEA3639254.1 ATP-binding protein [Lamprobacter sp.]